MLGINWLGMVALSVSGLLFVGIAYLRKRNVDFGLLTLIGLVLGVVVGVVFKGNVDYVKTIGTIYAQIITAIVAPLIIFSILSSVSSLSSVKKLKTIGLRAVGWLLLNTFLAIVLALGIGLLLGVGKNLNLNLDNVDTSSLNGKVIPFTQVLINFFPSNIVKDIQNNSIVPIIITSIVIGITYVVLSDKIEEKVLPFKKLVEAIKEILYKVIDYIIELTPYAVLSLVASAISKATNAKSAILPLLFILVVTYLVCAIHAYVVNGILVTTVAKLNPFRFFHKIFAAQATAFTSQSSVGTLPITIGNLTKKVGVSDEVANFVAPLGATIGMPACAGIWPILLSVVAINALHLNYSVGQYIALVILALVVSLGTAGVPGTATVTATAVFTAAGLPVSIIILLLPISTIADMARTATNITGAAVSAAIVARQENQLNLDIFSGIKSYEEINAIEPESTESSENALIPATVTQMSVKGE
jgi:Na+/H+-dicarboxylate symporter